MAEHTIRWRNLTIAGDAGRVGVHAAVGPWRTRCVGLEQELPLDPTDAPVTCVDCLTAEVVARAAWLRRGAS